MNFIFRERLAWLVNVRGRREVLVFAQWDASWQDQWRSEQGRSVGSQARLQQWNPRFFYQRPQEKIPNYNCVQVQFLTFSIKFTSVTLQTWGRKELTYFRKQFEQAVQLVTILKTLLCNWCVKKGFILQKLTPRRVLSGGECESQCSADHPHRTRASTRLVEQWQWQRYWTQNMIVQKCILAFCTKLAVLKFFIIYIVLCSKIRQPNYNFSV